MDLFTIIGACLRRWYVTVVLLGLTGFLALQAYEAVPAVYSSSTGIVVLPGNTQPEVPADEGEEVVLPENPYSGSGGTRFAAAVLARNINTDAYKERIGIESADEISFLADSDRDRPIITIEATGPTPEAVFTTLDAVVAEAGVVLAEFQTEAGAPEITQFRIAPAVPADEVEDVTPSRFRNAGAIAAIGMAVTAAVAVTLDSVLRNRRRRHRADVAADTESRPDEEARDVRSDDVDATGERAADDARTAQVETDEVDTDEVDTDDVNTDEVDTDDVDTEKVDTDKVDTGEVVADDRATSDEEPEPEPGESGDRSDEDGTAVRPRDDVPVPARGR